MDLNEKIAARRRELALEADKVVQVEAARQRQFSVEAERIRKRRQNSIDAEVAKQLAEMGINQKPPPISPFEVAAPKALLDEEVAKQPTEVGIDEAPPPILSLEARALKIQVDAEVEKALQKAASDRMTSGENATFVIFLLMGLVGFFVAWWVALGIIFASFMYRSSMTSKYKEQIVNERKTKPNGVQEAGAS